MGKWLCATLCSFYTISIFANDFHLPLDMSLQEYHKLYLSMKKTKTLNIKEVEVKKSIQGGEKLLKWIDLINQSRSEDQKIRLTKKAPKRGIPIDSPSKYGPSTIKLKLEELLSELPEEMSKRVYGGAELSNGPIVLDEEFIKWGRKISSLYQTAVRWTSMSRWLDYYEAAQAKDVRGYYYLKSLENLNQKLIEIKNLEKEEKEKILDALVGICENNMVLKQKCAGQVQLYISKNALVGLKDMYWQGAINNWNSFFQISEPRHDIKWSLKDPTVMAVVFKDPHSNKIASWLKENVEDEFKQLDSGWHLEMDFIRGGWGTAYLEFKKNVTPHVSGGNKIVMDANTDIEEYEVKWTIRHEFGHILRIPDCYHEFYNRSENLMINYQLDVNDLMCSRAGSMNKRIYDELKRVYLEKE